MSDTPTYRIESIEDFDAIPDDRLGACIADFETYLALRRLSRAVINSEAAKVTGTFVWFDDGIAGLSTVRFIDDDGELVASFDIQPPNE